MKRVLLFDLDETLMVEEPAATASFDATAQFAATHNGDTDPAKLAIGARSRARELWYAAPTHDYCMRVGISSWVGLWCRFEGEGPDERSLRAWSPTYRHEAWRLALADQGVDDPQLVEKLAERFGEERRARHEVFADAVGTLSQLKDHGALDAGLGAIWINRDGSSPPPNRPELAEIATLHDLPAVIRKSA